MLGAQLMCGAIEEGTEARDEQERGGADSEKGKEEGKREREQARKRGGDAEGGLEGQR